MGLYQVLCRITGLKIVIIAAIIVIATIVRLDLARFFFERLGNFH